MPRWSIAGEYFDLNLFRREERMRIIVVSGLLIAAMLTYGVPRTDATAIRADVKAELKMALFHIGMLARDGPAYKPPLHGQHVINCLEGPKGRNYEGFVHAGNPCAGQGNGIIPDLKDQAAAKIPGTQEALKQATLAWNVAVQGMAKNNFNDPGYGNEVKQWAKLVASYLKVALDALGS